MIHYYLQKGIAEDKILALSPLERTYYAASMVLAMEEQAELYSRLGGGG